MFKSIRRSLPSAVVLAAALSSAGIALAQSSAAKTELVTKILQMQRPALESLATVLAQQPDVMDAVQRLRVKAQANNKLTSTKEQKVSVAQQENKQVIVIEPAVPDTVYVPYYDPAVVYGGWPYPAYPPYYFPPPLGYVPGAVLATGIAFGAGYAVGRWASGGNYWGGGVNWGNNGGWNDAAPPNTFPDWAQILFNGSKIIDHVVVYTLQDNYANPASPTDTMTFSKYGVTDFTVQGWDGAIWVTLASVSGNNLVKRTVNFDDPTAQERWQS